MINKVILVGNVGNDPEVRHISEGVAVARFSLATSESYQKDGKRVDVTEWHNIVAWRGLAKVAEDYVKKGSLLYVEGKLKTQSYEKDGVKRYSTEIVADTFRMLGKKPGEHTNEVPPPPKNSQIPPQDITPEDPGDDLPF